jgi:Fe-S-cluster containining protein
MEKRETVFLTPGQALRAAAADLRQYAPQMMLICEVIRLIQGADTVIRSKTREDGAWVRVSGRRNMQWMTGPALVDHLCGLLDGVDRNSNLLLRICSRIFQAPAAPAVDPETGDPGILLETGMENFVCRQCGRCCRALDYRNALSGTDVEKWRRAGRTDILAWVGVFRKDTDREAYRMWIDPTTRQPVTVCPFLAKSPESNRWFCRIQNVKPSICTEYPFSRKHAKMTGCSGFDRKLPDRKHGK